MPGSEILMTEPTNRHSTLRWPTPRLDRPRSGQGDGVCRRRHCLRRTGRPPGGRAAYRRFMGPSSRRSRVRLLAAFGDDERRSRLRHRDGARQRRARCECVTVETARSPTAGSSLTEHPSTPPGSVPADGLIALSCTQILRAVHGTHADTTRCVGYRPASWISAAW
jgi:hypothetical protein